jgi:hypothetical protein
MFAGRYLQTSPHSVTTQKNGIVLSSYTALKMELVCVSETLSTSVHGVAIQNTSIGRESSCFVTRVVECVTLTWTFPTSFNFECLHKWNKSPVRFGSSLMAMNCIRGGMCLKSLLFIVVSDEVDQEPLLKIPLHISVCDNFVFFVDTHDLISWSNQSVKSYSAL